MLLRRYDFNSVPLLARTFLVSLVGNTCIALVLWLVVPAIGQHGLWSSFVFSQCIGISITGLSVLSSWLLDKTKITRLIRLLLIAPVVTVGAGAGFATAHWIMGTAKTVSDTSSESLLSILVTVIVASTFFYWFYSNQENVSDLKLAASEQERRADNARHAMLRAQLNPHMLFNTLANLRALITTDQDKALQMLDRLDGFLRETLDGSVGDGIHTLDKEFGILDNYLSLMQIRLADRLNFTLDLPTDLQSISVPSLLLQPIVENSVRHGLEPQSQRGEIIVTARRDSEVLKLTVRDNGKGISGETRDGFGLSNLKERVTSMYGDTASVQVSAGNPGCVVCIELPINRLTEIKP